jgi:hypothetical protein
MELINNKTIGTKINIIEEVTGYTGINEFDADVPNRQSLIKNIEKHAKDDMKLFATDVSHNENIFPENTLIRNNKRSNVTKMNIPVQSPIIYVPKSFYVELREYNGRVIKIDKTKFIAELINTANENEVLEAEFDISDIDKGDMGLFRVGALFVWKIGKEENNGTQQKVSQLVFRRLSSWRTIDIKRIEEIARSKAAAIRAITVEESTAAQ